jgi:hypothetical protein
MVSSAALMLIRTVQAAPPTLSVNPSASKVRMGEQLTANVNLDSATNLYGYEVWLSFNSSVLRATSINYTGYLNEPTYVWHQEINNTGGYIGFSVSSHLPAGSKTGGSPPPLVTVYFRGNGVGTSALSLSKTILVDDRAMEILHQVTDATVQVELMLGHDVAVTDIISSKTVACQRCNASFRLFVQNQGTFTETFNVTLRANTSIINTQPVTLSSGTSKTLTVTWANIDSPIGNFTLKAEAVTSEDIDPTDNTLVDGTITISIKGDVTADGKVNILDIAIVAKSFASKQGQDRWNSNADLNEDQIVNILDIAMVAKEFGKTQ